MTSSDNAAVLYSCTSVQTSGLRPCKRRYHLTDSFSPELERSQGKRQASTAHTKDVEGLLDLKSVTTDAKVCNPSPRLLNAREATLACSWFGFTIAFDKAFLQRTSSLLLFAFTKRPNRTLLRLHRLTEACILAVKMQYIPLILHYKLPENAAIILCRTLIARKL